MNNIYNPKDCWHKPLFIINEDMTIYENKECSLLRGMTQKNGEKYLAECRAKTDKSMRDEMEKEKLMQK